MKKVFVLSISCLLMTLLLGVKPAQGQGFPPQPGEIPPYLCAAGYFYTTDTNGHTVTLGIINSQSAGCPTARHTVWRFSEFASSPGSCAATFVGSVTEDANGRATIIDTDVPTGYYYYLIFILEEREGLIPLDSGIYRRGPNVFVNRDRFRDSIALADFYNRTNGADWNTKWDLTEPIDIWHGVTTNEEGRVESLVMGNNNITGILPPSISDLSELKILGLGGNEMGDTIPAQIARLSQLTNLGLGGNNFTGGIPPQIGSMTNLEQLWLGGNNNLGGSIPPELGQLTNLTHLVLNDCGLTGNLPKELAGQSSIYYWRIFNNDLTGCYPPELAIICSRLRPGFNGDDKISDGNDFDASWEDFCSNQSGLCEVEEKVSQPHISDYNIYPNPAENGTTIRLEFDSHTDSKDAILSIYNFNKQLVQSEDLTIQNGQNQFTTTLKNYAAGIYFVKLQSGTYVGTQKLVIQ